MLLEFIRLPNRCVILYICLDAHTCHDQMLTYMRSLTTSNDSVILMEKKVRLIMIVIRHIALLVQYIGLISVPRLLHQEQTYRSYTISAKIINYLQCHCPPLLQVSILSDSIPTSSSIRLHFCLSARFPDASHSMRIRGISKRIRRPCLTTISGYAFNPVTFLLAFAFSFPFSVTQTLALLFCT